MGQPFHRRYVVAQAVQVMETAVLNNAAGPTTFKELGAAEVRGVCVLLMSEHGQKACASGLGFGCVGVWLGGVIYIYICVCDFCVIFVW